MDPHVSVAICTRDRAPMLTNALRSLVDCEAPQISWEVLVVDNGSSDATGRIASGFANDLALRCVREARPGLSHARNRAVREAAGEWILWIDDDVTVEPGWLAAYAGAIGRHPEARVLGGQIVARFQGRPPDWLAAGERWVRDAYAVRASSEMRGPIALEGSVPYGANFGLRRRQALRFPFDPRLGRHPKHPTRGGEESRVIRELLGDGGEGWWVPEARVTHHIDATRQTAGYLRSYYATRGRSAARDWRSFAPRGRLACATHSLRKALAHEARYRMGGLTGETREQALHLKEAAWNWGYLEGCVRRLGAPG